MIQIDSGALVVIVLACLFTVIVLAVIREIRRENAKTDAWIEHMRRVGRRCPACQPWGGWYLGKMREDDGSYETHTCEVCHGTGRRGTSVSLRQPNEQPDRSERAKLRDRIMVEARRQRWYCWVAPATGVGDNWEAHFNWQSVWTSCGLNYDGERAFSQAVEMVRGAYADRQRDRGVAA